MEVDATPGGAAGSGRDRDVDGAVERFEQLPKRGSGAVAQHCSFSTSEHRSHPACMVAGSAVSNRVHAAVEAMEPTAFRPFGDRRSPEPHRRELLRGDDSVLPSRYASDRRVGPVAFVRHTRTKSTGPSDPPPLRAALVPRCGFAAALRGLGDLAGLEAAGADVGAEGAAVLLDPNLLEVRIEAALGGDHRMASGV